MSPNPSLATDNSSPLQATAVAHPNIALIKYWCKANEELIIPVASSMSMTLDKFATTTTVELRGESAGPDIFTLNGAPAETTRVSAFLEIVREKARAAGLATAAHPAIVTSKNEGPTAAGMASSASGFAALAIAAASAYGLKLTERELSRLARRGSGSASRSVINRFAVWHAGDDDATSYAEQIHAPEMAMVATTVSASTKKVSSRQAMRATRDTSPFYPHWAQTTEQLLEEMLAACAANDFTRIGECTETHALRMHALINSTRPSIRYLSPVSWQIFDAVAQLREDGVETYATADAGPNVVALCRPADTAAVAERLTAFAPVETFHPGPGAYLVNTSELPDAAATVQGV